MFFSQKFNLTEDQKQRIEAMLAKLDPDDRAILAEKADVSASWAAVLLVRLEELHEDLPSATDDEIEALILRTERDIQAAPSRIQGLLRIGQRFVLKEYERRNGAESTTH